MSPVTFTRLENGDFQLQTEQMLPHPVEPVFDFFADADNLEAITPPWLNFRITTSLPIDMKKGAIIEYRLRLRIVPIRWKTLISDWVPNERFVDEALKSPYKLWHHTHEFEPVEGGTLVRDTVRYRVPFGGLVERLFVRSELRKIFEYRYAQMEKIFSADESPVAS